MRLPKIELVGQNRARPTVLVDGKALRPWRYAIRRTVGNWKRWKTTGNGMTRGIYLIQNRYVLKVDLIGYWCGLQASQEIRIWKGLDAEDRQHFGSLIAWQAPRGMRRGWVLQPRLRFRPGARPVYGWKTVERLAEKYDLCDFLVGSQDKGAIGATRNWGMVTRRGRGVPVIYDYGY